MGLWQNNFFALYYTMGFYFKRNTLRDGVVAGELSGYSGSYAVVGLVGCFETLLVYVSKFTAED